MEEDLERESHNQVELSAACVLEQERGGYFWTCEDGRMSFIMVKYKTCFENFTIFHLGSNKTCWQQTQRTYIFRAGCANGQSEQQSCWLWVIQYKPFLSKDLHKCPSHLQHASEKSLPFSVYFPSNSSSFQANTVNLQLFLQKWGRERYLLGLCGSQEWCCCMLLCFSNPIVDLMFFRRDLRTLFQSTGDS